MKNLRAKLEEKKKSKAVEQKAFQDRAEPVLKKVAEMRMRKLLDSMYPEMSEIKRQEIASNFRKKIGLMSDADIDKYFAGTPTKGVVFNGTLETKIKMRDYGNIHNSDSIMNTIDHEAVHFLGRSLGVEIREPDEEVLARSISHATNPSSRYARIKTEKKAEKVSSGKKSFLFKSSEDSDAYAAKWPSAGALGYPLSIIKFGKTYAPSNSVGIMSNVIAKKFGEEEKNKFLRSVMDRKNPVDEFNKKMQIHGISAELRVGRIVFNSKKREK